MSKVITFSRFFPKGHPRQGDDTNFVEQILNVTIAGVPMFAEHFKLLNTDLSDVTLYEFTKYLNRDIDTEKVHTIRKGTRWKVGDKFSPRVWSGKPYQSKMIKISQDVEIKKVWNTWIIYRAGILEIYIEDEIFSSKKKDYAFLKQRIEIISKNDGLMSCDFISWFKNSIPKDGTFFRCQIICWDESINY